MPTARPLRTGDPLRLGEYELSGRLGEGGQGVVFLGSRNGETYAVKLLHGPVGDERAAFLREVELAKHVARFCTAQVVDAGFDDGRPYIVSEYVDGPSLAREVALTGPRRGGALERLAVGTATAITAIHRAGIVHRDFKPQNVLLGSDGPRVIDFGLARALDAAATVSGRGVGTPAYMAPEQITASAVTGKADVFAWAATMCFAANATAPFGQDSVAPVLHRILTAPPELGRLEGRLRALVEACLDKDARNRPGSRELLFELLGDSSAGLPPEVLATPPPHLLRAASPPVSLVPEQRSPAAEPAAGPVAEPAAGPIAEPAAEPAAGPIAGPIAGPVAEPEATGTPGGYLLPGGDASRETALAGGGAGGGSGGAGGRHGSTVTGPPRDRDGRSVVTRGDPARRAGWLRAALAVCVALLATAAVLLAVLVPTLARNGQAAQVAGPPAPSRPAPTQPGGTVPIGSATRPRHSHQNLQNPAADPPTAAQPGTDPATALPGGVTVPPLAGLDRAGAIRAIKRAGLVPGAVTQADSPRRIGQVLSSRPAAGTRAAKGTRVALQVSAGLPVPAVVGLRREAAASALVAAGLRAGAVTRTCSAQPDGRVVAARPGPGTRVAGGTAVALTLSRRGAAVPSVVGRSRDSGRAVLQSAGFTVRVQGQVVSDPARVGTVLAQSVQPGTCARTGAAIVLTVGSQGQPSPGPGEPSSTPTAPSGGSEEST
ncbi:PASTA domain-containing protein [Nonomuraea sp. NPDC050783]|uniref:serine/threonine-protein kinase n=1 Tax=Nonomuraea sp. NPDC050783 TaxID=3154634 RepID=UPI003466E088